MQNLLRVSKGWHDPAPDLSRGVFLILCVLCAEAGAWLVHRGTALDPIHVLGVARAAQAVFLLFLGPWTLRGPAFRAAALRGLVFASMVAVAGIAALCVWVRIPFLPDPGLSRAVSPGAAWPAFLFTAALASPIAEELVFRGIFYRSLRVRLSWLPATALVSGVFAGLHVIFGGGLITPLAGSLIFCAGYEKDKTIVTPACLHIFGNLIIFAAARGGTLFHC
jgi:membrane protease YdiL (CAAX protease family)